MTRRLAILLGGLFVPVILYTGAATLGQDGPKARARGADTARTAPAAARPKTRVAKCLNDTCHADHRKFKFLHGPSLVGACEMCHTYVDPAKHTFKLKRPKDRLCDFCHIGQTEGLYVHKPVKQGQCLGCHNPHGSSNRELLRKGDVGALCTSCHDKVTRGKKFVHGPVRTGSCAACHRSHASMYPKLLPSPKQRLCLDCHKQMDLQLARVRYVHKPVKTGCEQCHETHASNYTMHLKESPKKICVSCHEHEKMAKEIDQAPFKHSPVSDTKSCMNCHISHGGDLANLVRSEAGVACLSCHDKPIQSDAGRREVASIAELGMPGMNRHGPIRDGSCKGCHDVHGGKISRLLTMPYPETFYEAYKSDKYGLCFSCHTEQLAVQKQTDTVTEFRNGKTNLHYIHVNKPKRGRSCRACHSTHASSNAMHVAETVPFGNWKLPIKFTPTETGGSCASGCHRELGYDRVKPIKLGPGEKPKVKPKGSKEDANTRPSPELLENLAKPASTPATKPKGTN